MAENTNEQVVGSPPSVRRLHFLLATLGVFSAAASCAISPLSRRFLLAPFHHVDANSVTSVFGLFIVLFFGFAWLARITRADLEREFIDSPISLAMLLAIPLTLVCYKLLENFADSQVNLPTHTAYSAIAEFIRRVFFRQEWISVLIVLVFWTGEIALLLQLIEIKREGRLTPTHQAMAEILAEPTYEVSQASHFLGALKQEPLSEFSDTSFSKRMQLAFKRINLTQSSVGVDSLLESLSSADSQIADASQRYLHFLLFLLPALGFLGTIIGLSNGLGNFHEALASQDMHRIVQYLDPLLADLGMAFSTTLLGLVGSIFISLGASYVGKRLDQLLSRIESDSVEVIVSRLQFSDPSMGSTMRKLQSLCDSLSTKSVQDRIRELSSAVESIKAAVTPVVASVNDLTLGCNNLTQTLTDGLKPAIASFIEESGKSASTAWIKGAEETSRRILNSSVEVSDSLKAACESYSKQIGLMTTTIGQNQDFSSIQQSLNALSQELSKLHQTPALAGLNPNQASSAQQGVVQTQTIVPWWKRLLRTFRGVR